MSQKVSDYFVPPFDRKKRIIPPINPNTYRVLFEDAYYDKAREGLALKPYPDHLTPSHPLPPANNFPRPSRDLRHNNPSATLAGFLWNNPGNLNKAVCHVVTHDRKNEQDQWFRHDLPKVQSATPKFTYDTTSRNDFQPWNDPSAKATRHSGKPNDRPARGIVPINTLKEEDEKVRIWREKISYEHAYNSRKDSNYPIRAKREGGFVWHRQPEGTLEDIRNYEEHKDELLVKRFSEERPDWMQRKYHPDEDCLDRRIPPGRNCHERQFVRYPKPDSVAACIQPEYESPWKQPPQAPQFTA